ncbi:MAG TPA: hypothetical protein VFM18_08230, partial [Methanosarcina sp.]|nr:hypothetical protein [Methanosarcina sp.]
MLEKLIDTQSFFRDDELTVTLLDLKDTSTKGLEKAAADSRITDYVKDLLEPKPGKFYLHINAMGAGEYYGSNKNADYFPEEQLKQFHKTFEETGYVYRHHINKDPARSMGRVLYSIYNERMHRVELIAEVDSWLGQDVMDSISRGEFPKTSMACRTPYDVCSICGNRAHTRQEYCVHITNSPNRVLADGRKVMAMNVAPLRFFDISIVIKPADITSSVLQKVASADCVLSVDAAAEEGLDYSNRESSHRVKQAAMKKMSELIKIIDDGVVTKTDPRLEEIMDRMRDPDEKLLALLTSIPLDQSLNSLAELGISPSIAFLAQLVAKTEFGMDIPRSLAEVIEHMVVSLHPSQLPREGFDKVAHVDEIDASPFITSAITRLCDCSLFESDIEKRASIPELYEGYLDRG